MCMCVVACLEGNWSKGWFEKVHNEPMLYLQRMRSSEVLQNLPFLTIISYYYSRKGVCSLPWGLQPFAHYRHRLPHAPSQDGCTSCNGYSKTQERDRPEWWIPAPAVPTQRKTGEGGQVEDQIIEYALPHIYSQMHMCPISSPSILTECMHTSRA